MNIQNTQPITPAVFAPNAVFRLVEHRSLEEMLSHIDMGHDLSSYFQHVTANSAYKTLHPVQEPEYGIYTRTPELIKLAPAFLSANRNMYLNERADRNYQYITFSLGHRDPDHPLNNEYIAQWRIESDIMDAKDPNTAQNIRFCIKSRDKTNTMRDELETKVHSLDQRKAILTLQESETNKLKAGQTLPAILQTPAEELGPDLFVTSISVVSRSGYNGIQHLRKRSTDVLHKFSHDAQLAADINLNPLCWRYEIEDEVDGFIPQPEFGRTNDPEQEFTSIVTSALNTNRSILSANFQRHESIPIKSKLSKAELGESASQGHYDQSAIKHPNAREQQISFNQMRNTNRQVWEYFHDTRMRMGLLLLLNQLPEKGSIFPKNFEPNHYSVPPSRAVA